MMEKKKKIGQLMEMVVLVLVLLTSVLHGAVTGHQPGIYVDNGFDQTVLEPFLNRYEKEEMEDEMLTLLGQFAHLRSFMLDVYNSMDSNEETGNLRIRANHRSSRDLKHFGVTEGDVVGHVIETMMEKKKKIGQLMEMVVLVLVLLTSVLHGAVTGHQPGIYVDNGFDQTVLEPFLNRYEKEEMEDEMLTLLGQFAHLRSFMLDVYNSMDSNEETGNLRIRANHRSSRDLKHFGVTEGDVVQGHHFSAGRLRHGDHHQTRFWFDVRSAPWEQDDLIGAELRVYKEGLKPPHAFAGSKTPFNVEVYQVIPSLTSSEKRLDLISKLNTTLDYDGWLTFNVTKAFTDWMVFPDTNFGLYLDVNLADGHVAKPIQVGLHSHHLVRAEKEPFLAGFFKSSESPEGNVLHARKARRAVSNGGSQGGKKKRKNNSKSHAKRKKLRIPRHSNCGRRNLYVSFKDLNWQDWIIAPNGYPAFYCEGECTFPLNAQMNATNHAIVQTLVNLMSQHTAPKPCCAPTKLGEVSVIFYDDDSNVILKRYRNMQVKACGCH
ncbi:unnamed protein product [Notodromas monacha]|uniref:TGF-beta family profile domain-containing protein n=1 Tax=Notodromas monacha TaxID=399045 RepID=A0A7R9GCR3_9CRUS|nr:unnamed protein product [Notodromas monacha]CAG0916127.1 unnamed protein product [Notodromas monacha]